MGFFKATHKTTGEVVSFGLEDIHRVDSSHSYKVQVGEYLVWIMPNDYTLQYHHAGQWHDYKIGGDNE